jgi:hypothetical protein
LSLNIISIWGEEASKMSAVHVDHQQNRLEAETEVAMVIEIVRERERERRERERDKKKETKQRREEMCHVLLFQGPR